jgi:uncharacterized protein (TIGR01244 family)
MFPVKQAFTIVVLGIALAACQIQEQVKPQPAHGFNTLAENLVTGGQPSQADLMQLKKIGVTKVINLRGPNEDIPFNEEAEAATLGLEYIALPISDAADVSVENARQLHELLRGDEKVLLHCASGNRAGALLAIRAHLIEGKPMDESLKFGRAAGLSSLEEKVKSVLDDGNTATHK